MLGAGKDRAEDGLLDGEQKSEWQIRSGGRTFMRQGTMLSFCAGNFVFLFVSLFKPKDSSVLLFGFFWFVCVVIGKGSVPIPASCYDESAAAGKSNAVLGVA